MIFNSPKNFKRGRLINNRYRPIDFIVIASAVVITLILEIFYLVIMQGKSVFMAALFVIPAVIVAALLILFRLYHNVMELSGLYIIYLQIRKKWMWEGIYKYELIEKKKMTKLEKKQATVLKKAKKDAKYVKRKVATTLDWIDIQEVGDNYILIGKEKRKIRIKGIKLFPHNIFLDEPEEQARRIEKLRFCFNKLPFELFFSFVYTPANADDHISELLKADKVEDDVACKRMIKEDFNKIYEFQEAYRELEFFVMIRDKDDKQLNKRYMDMFGEFEAAGFLP